MRRWGMAGLSVGLLTAILAGCGLAITSHIDDGTITTRVRTALLYDSELAQRCLGVSTVDRVVTLSGTVLSPDEAERALRVTRSVPGVRAVRSELVQRSPGNSLPPPT